MENNEKGRKERKLARTVMLLTIGGAVLVGYKLGVHHERELTDRMLDLWCLKDPDLLTHMRDVNLLVIKDF